MENQISFDQLPKAVNQINKQLQRIESLLLDKKEEPKDQWFDLNDLIEYDPEKRTKATFYGYIHKREIPFHKRGKKLTFLKSEIDEWLKSHRKQTLEELESGVSIKTSRNEQ